MDWTHAILETHALLRRMVVNDFNVFRAGIGLTEAQPRLIVDANAVLDDRAATLPVDYPAVNARKSSVSAASSILSMRTASSIVLTSGFSSTPPTHFSQSAPR
jgi:hypothetical protein